MSPAPIILAALSSSCRVLLNHRQLQSAEKREVIEFHLRWMELVHSDSVNGNGSKAAAFEDLALSMARFVIDHEQSPPTNQLTIPNR
jgi:hypothetical protein